MELIKLSKIAKISSGLTAPPDNDFSEVGVPFIRVSNLDDIIATKSFENVGKISPETAKSRKMAITEKDSIVFAKSGMSCLKNRVLKLNKACYIVNHLASVSVTSSKVNINYLSYYILWFKPSKLIIDESYPSIRLSDVGEMIIPLPPLETQKKIVEALDKVQALIDARKEQIRLMDELVKSRFIEMFGDPVVNEKKWKVKKLHELVTPGCTISYGIVQTGDNQSIGVPVFRPIDIVNNVPELNKLKKTTEEISGKYKKTILQGRELLITVRANIGDTYIADERFKGCNVGRGIVPIRTDEKKIGLEFLKYQLDNERVKNDMKSKAKGITLIQLNMEDLRNINLILPNISIQKEYVDFAKKAEGRRMELQTNLNELIITQQALMQQYFG